MFRPLEIDDLTPVTEVAKQFNERLKGIQKWVEKTVTTQTSKVKEEVESKAQEAESAKILKFAETHPELKGGSEVAAIMEQLYKTNQDLEEIYTKACNAAGVKPIAIVEGKKVNLTTNNEIDEDGKEVAKKEEKKKDTEFSSLRSDEFNSDAEDVDSGDLHEGKDIEGKTIREVAELNWNKALADADMSDIPE